MRFYFQSDVGYFLSTKYFGKGGRRSLKLLFATAYEETNAVLTVPSTSSACSDDII